MVVLSGIVIYVENTFFYSIAVHVTIFFL